MKSTTECFLLFRKVQTKQANQVTAVCIKQIKKISSCSDLKIRFLCFSIQSITCRGAQQGQQHTDIILYIKNNNPESCLLDLPTHTAEAPHWPKNKQNRNAEFVPCDYIGNTPGRQFLMSTQRKGQFLKCQQSTWAPVNNQQN